MSVTAYCPVCTKDLEADGWCFECRANVSETTLSAELELVAVRLAELRIQRDNLIRAHPGTLREIAEAAGLSFQQVGNIKNRKEERK